MVRPLWPLGLSSLLAVEVGFVMVASSVARGAGALSHPQAVSFSDGAGPFLRSVEGAFSAAECGAIEAVFERREVEVDERAGEGISRVNRWLRDPTELRWVLRRVLELVPANDPFWGFDDASLAPDDVDALESRLDFALMHEFSGGRFFDWHVDTKPGDGTSRTLNVNVVLSPREAFEGGELQVGTANATLGLGDLHAYPAACPHKVHDVIGGRRRTLVLAVRASAKKTGDDASRAASLDAAARRYTLLCDALGAPKLHWIFGQFLEARGAEAEALEKFGHSYAATAQKADYVAALTREAAELHEAKDLLGAAKALEICVAIEPRCDFSEPSHATDLGVVQWKLGRLEEAERSLRTALSNENVKETLAAIHAALSVVLVDANKPKLAADHRALAVAADESTALGALEQLERIRQK